MPLTEAQTGTEYRVASVYERDRKLLEFLDNEGDPARRSHWLRWPELSVPCAPGNNGDREDLGREIMIIKT